LNDQETFLALGFGQTERLFLLSVLSDRETFPKYINRIDSWISAIVSRYWE
jgi:hypothetical protein